MQVVNSLCSKGHMTGFPIDKCPFIFAMCNATSRKGTNAKADVDLQRQHQTRSVPCVLVFILVSPIILVLPNESDIKVQQSI